MSEEKVNVLDQALADILLQASESMGKATEFALAEIPDVVQQALLWYGIYSLILCVMGIGALIACYKMTVIGFRDYKNKETFFGDLHYQSAGAIWAGVVGIDIILFIVSLASLINLTWLKIWIAPKLWMIEYAASIVK